jgi:hypothetical protein
MAEFSKSSCRMTNEKSSMTNLQFRFSALVAACRAGPLRSCLAGLFGAAGRRAAVNYGQWRLLPLNTGEKTIRLALGRQTAAKPKPGGA